jgi:hypothetical protein
MEVHFIFSAIAYPRSKIPYSNSVNTTVGWYRSRLKSNNKRFQYRKFEMHPNKCLLIFEVRKKYVD